MIKSIDIKFLVGGVAAMVIGMLTVTGHVQQVIHFADPLNEMFFASMSFIGGLFSISACKK